ncbi:hypothetical protein BH10ACT7_BH10ACT7_02320 [soil metagenome]
MPLTKRQIFLRRRVAVFGGAALVLGGAFYLPLTLLAPLPEMTAVVASYEAPPVEQPVLGFPGYGAAAIGAVGYDGVLARAGATDPLPIASISKVVTALVVLDAHPLAVGESGAEITFTDQDVAFYDQQLADDGIVADVRPGQVMSQLNVLTVMLMMSANNYGQTLATWAFGSEAAYVDAARVWLADNGFARTSINDATGMNPANTSTVDDLIGIGKLALENPVIAAAVSTQSLDVPELGAVGNRNGLLGINGVDGIKTGTLDESGACLLFSADHLIGGESITLVGVVLGGPDHATINAAIQGLLTEVDAGFREVSLTTAGQVFADYDSPWGDEAEAVAAGPATAVVWAGTPITSAIDVESIRLGEAGEEVGSITFTFANRVITVPLELDDDIDDPGAWWRLTNPAVLF